MPDEVVTWLNASARERRLLLTLLFLVLLSLALLSANYRAIFMPWEKGDHPLVNPQAGAFFAGVPPGINAPGERLTRRVPRKPFGLVGINDLPITSGSANPIVGPDDSLPPLTDQPIIDLPLIDLPASLASAGGAGDDGTIGSSPIGAPTAFIAAAAIPEPSTWLMAIIGFGMIGTIFRRLRRAPVTA